MDFISERVGYTKTPEDLTIYIKGSKKSDALKIRYMKIWIILCLVSLFLLIVQFFLPYSLGAAKYYLVGLIGFLIYFIYIAVKAYYFRKYGIETIYINNDKFMIRRDIYTKQGKPKWFKANEKNPFSKVDEKPGGINAFFYSSFWVVTGGTIMFGAKRSEFRFGIQLSDEEAHKVVNMMNKAISLHHKK
jgi:hypothetical protein